MALAIGVPLSAIVATSDANIALDRSAPEVSQVPVESKRIRVSRTRSGTRNHHHVVLKPISPNPASIPPELEVSGATYGGIREGGRLEILLRRGAPDIP